MPAEKTLDDKTPDDFRAQAADQTGLDDFGDSGYLEGSSSSATACAKTG